MPRLTLYGPDLTDRYQVANFAKLKGKDRAENFAFDNSGDVKREKCIEKGVVPGNMARYWTVLPLSQVPFRLLSPWHRQFPRNKS